MAIPGKESFLLYHDQRPMIEKLSDAQAGMLIKAIYRYSEFEEIPLFEDPVTEIVFVSMCAAIDRASKRYLDVVERNRENGKMGGRPRKNPVG